MDELMDRIDAFRSNEKLQKDIAYAYSNGPFNNVGDMAPAVCSFISKRH